VLPQSLEGDGHQVTAADGGQAAIDAFLAAEQNGESFAAVITDLGMLKVARQDLARTEQNSASARRATQSLHDLLSGPPDTTIRTALRSEFRRIVQRIDIIFDLAESPQGTRRAREMEAFAKLAKKAGAKMLLSADGVVPKRSFTIVFRTAFAALSQRAPAASRWCMKPTSTGQISLRPSCSCPQQSRSLKPR